MSSKAKKSKIKLQDAAHIPDAKVVYLRLLRYAWDY
jgi:hypothetical protein